jgi:L,D-peptidoglycan transpeptidase YkuD (ErfK/YbiS/YcfS/YnhG family)
VRDDVTVCTRRLRVVLTTLAVVTVSCGGVASESDTRMLDAQPRSVDSTATSAIANSATSGASTTTTAVRGAATQTTPVPEPGPFPAGPCDLDLVARLSVAHPTTRQFVVVLTESFADVSGTVQFVTVSSKGARCRLAPMFSMLGRSGTRPLLERRSGDGTTPAGVFPLGVVESPQGPVSFFGTRPDPGVQGDYRQVRAGDCYGATPNTPGYGHWRTVSSPSQCTSPDEYLPSFVNSYAHAALIVANSEPDVSGDAPGEIPYASAIFLHRHSYATDGVTPRPVSGCVTLALDDLRATLRLIDPAANPVFAIGPREYLLSTVADRG